MFTRKEREIILEALNHECEQENFDCASVCALIAKIEALSVQEEPETDSPTRK